MYRCKCGREFDTTSSYAGHCSHCEIHLGHEDKDRFGDSRAWRRGKTKETDSRIAAAAEKQRQRILSGEQPKSFLGKKHTDKTKQKMSTSARRVAIYGKNGWKCGDNHIQNKYEIYASEFLASHQVAFEPEVNIPQSTFGKRGSYYQFDFLVNGSIDLEIDGSIHLTKIQREHDMERDSYVKQQYNVYRIQHHDDIGILDCELNKFLGYINSV